MYFAQFLKKSFAFSAARERFKRYPAYVAKAYSPGLFSFKFIAFLLAKIDLWRWEVSI